MDEAWRHWWGSGYEYGLALEDARSGSISWKQAFGVARKAGWTTWCTVSSYARAGGTPDVSDWDVYWALVRPGETGILSAIGARSSH